jgi:serine/threonine-protein kinase HipA
MNELAKKVVSHHIVVSGVQPKLSPKLIEELLNQQNAKRITVVGALGGNYIFKPPPSTYPEIPENEHLTMKIAEGFGVPMVPSSLIRLQSGELAYITKRIDKTRAVKKSICSKCFKLSRPSINIRAQWSV